MAASVVTSLVPTPFVTATTEQSSQIALIQDLYNKGRDLYGKSFMDSRNLFLGSLYLQFTQINFAPQTLGTVSTDTDFTNVDNTLITSDKIALVERVQSNKLTTAQRLFLAQTLRWLGHCYQNIPEFQDINDETNARFEFLYGAAEELLKLDDSKEARLEMAELYYNTGFFIHLRKKPGDYLGACETYEKALKYNSTPPMIARVNNMRGMLYKKAGVPLSAEQFKTNILDPYLALPETEKNTFLVAMYHNNYASCLFQELSSSLEEKDLKLNLEKIDAALSVTQEHMEKAERGEVPLHAYFGDFYQNIAKLRALQGKDSEAAAALQKAEDHAARNPEKAS